ncbi:hypothetical protein C8T65DRAFT_744320 [Cerioporus squamosus]|nr:hypothetical protein C8T65DRAFT_744320 [Cerioporus squamosus]
MLSSPSTIEAPLEFEEDKKIIIDVQLALSDVAPFNKASADTVIRTSGMTTLLVFRWIIEDASPVLKRMLLEAPATTPPQRTITSLPESHRTLAPLLRLYHPEPTVPMLASFEEAIRILLAADKYQLTFSSRTLRRKVVPPLIAKNPLRTYAFAVKHGLKLKDIAQAAAKAYSRTPATPDDAFTEELEDMSAGAYRRLSLYRAQCSAALCELDIQRTCEWHANLGWSMEDYTSFTCPSCVTHNPRRPACKRRSCGHAAPWFVRHWERLLEVLRATPHPAAVEDFALTDHAVSEAWACETCRKTVAVDMRRFTERFMKVVEEVVDKVELKIK